MPLPAHARGRQLHEHHRLLGRLLAGLGGVGGVVEADAEDRARARDGGEQGDVGERVLLAVGRGGVAGGEAVEHGAGARRRRPVAAHLPGACSVPSGVRNVASRMARDRTFVWASPRLLVISTTMGRMDVGAIQAASVATTASYRSFADATRSVLDLLEAAAARRHAVPLAPRSRPQRAPDRRHARRRDASACRPTRRRRCATPTAADGRGPGPAPRATTSPPTRPTRRLDVQQQLGAVSYLGVPLELSDRIARRQPRRALAHARRASRDADEQLFAVLARVLSSRARARELDARPAADVGDPARARPRARRARPRHARRCPAAATRAPPSAAPPARSPPPPSPSCSSRPAASSSRPRWSASTSRR